MAREIGQHLKSKAGWKECRELGRLRLKLLGGFEAQIISGPVLDIATRKSRALLAYLAFPTGRPHSRDKLVGLLWSDRGDEQARNSLRQALTELGKALSAVEPSPLLKLRDTLALDPATVEVDALIFEGLAARDATSDLKRAAELYAGDLLDGLDARDAAFEYWLTIERQRLRGLAATVLKKLLTHDSGPSAIAVDQRLLALDPLQEEGHRALMRLYVEAGEASAALRQYELCRVMLKRDLDAIPSPETEALFSEIRQRPGGSTAPSPDHAQVVPTHKPQPHTPALSKPIIAVLPFVNMSGDPGQQYFSDGLTEDIITELSRLRSLTVIARHSSFAFRSQAIDVVEVSQRLGAGLVVEGSVRRAGNRVRITARLIDAESGSQVWSEHYDRELTDIFAVQDEIVRAIVATLPGRIDEAGMSLARRKRPENMTAYDCYLRGVELYLTMDRNAEPVARQWFEKALASDPKLAIAYSWIAALHFRDWYLMQSAEDLEQALIKAKRGATLDPNDSQCQNMLGCVRLYRKEFGEAAFHLERALALNPNNTRAMEVMAWLATYRGRATEGLDWMDTALRLNPYPPPWFAGCQAMVLYGLHRYEEAAAILSRESIVDAWISLYLVASLGQLGRLAEAQAWGAQFREEQPERSLLQFAAIEPYENLADLDHLLDGLRKAHISA